MGSEGRPLRSLAQVPCPRVAPYVEDSGDARAEKRTVEEFRTTPQLGLDVRVGVLVAQVHEIGSAIGPARLGEVDVGVDEARRDPATRESPYLKPRWDFAIASGAGADDPAIFEDDDGVRHRRCARTVDECCTDERQPRRRPEARRRRRQNRHREGQGKYHHRTEPPTHPPTPTDRPWRPRRNQPRSTHRSCASRPALSPAPTRARCSDGDSPPRPIPRPDW